MTQMPIDFGIGVRARETWQAVARVLREIADAATIKELAYRCDVSPSLLAAALGERERNYVRAEWLPVFLAAASEIQQRELLGALAGAFGYEVARRRQLTPEERLQRLEENLRQKLGLLGEQLIGEVGR